MTGKLMATTTVDYMHLRLPQGYLAELEERNPFHVTLRRVEPPHGWSQAELEDMATEYELMNSRDAAGTIIDAQYNEAVQKGIEAISDDLQCEPELIISGGGMCNFHLYGYRVLKLCSNVVVVYDTSKTDDFPIEGFRTATVQISCWGDDSDKLLNTVRTAFESMEPKVIPWHHKISDDPKIETMYIDEEAAKEIKLLHYDGGIP